MQNSRGYSKLPPVPMPNKYEKGVAFESAIAFLSAITFGLAIEYTRQLSKAPIDLDLFGGSLVGRDLWSTA